MTPSQAKEIHRDVDAKIEGLKKGVRKTGDGKKIRITCKEGCDACCYEPLMVERGEALLAVQAWKKQHPGRMEFLNDRIRSAVKSLKDAWVHKAKGTPATMYRTLGVPCPFLDQLHGVCTIYESRPYGCRTHLAVGPRRLCDVDALRHEQQFVTSSDWKLRKVIKEKAPGLQDMDHFIFHLGRRIGMKIESASRSVVDVQP